MTAPISELFQDDGLAVGDVKVIKERNRNIWIGGTLGVLFLKETGPNADCRGTEG